MKISAVRVREFAALGIVATYAGYGELRNWLMVIGDFSMPSPGLPLHIFYGLLVLVCLIKPWVAVSHMRVSKADFLFAGYICASLAVCVYNAVVLDPSRFMDGQGVSAHELNLGAVYLHSGVYAAIRFMTPSQIQKASAYIAGLAVICGVIAILVRGFPINFQSVQEDARGSYLYLSDVLIVFGTMAGATARGRTYRILWLATVTIILYALGSRTSFFLYLMIVPLLLIHSEKGVLRGAVVMAGMMAIPALLVVLMVVSPESRILSIVGSVSGDGSIAARALILSEGVEQIRQHPILGAYGGQVDLYNNSYRYIHNVLSIWQQYGLGPFLLFMSWLYQVVRSSVILLRAKNVPLNVRAAALVGLYSVAALLVARSHVHIAPVIGAAIPVLMHSDIRAGKRSSEQR